MYVEYIVGVICSTSSHGYVTLLLCRIRLVLFWKGRVRC